MIANTDATELNCIGPDPHPGMIQLPVAPRINHRIRFAPLSTNKQVLILPQAALKVIDNLRSSGAKTDSVLLYGPGDPLAEIKLAIETAERVRAQFPHMKVVVRTLGIGGLQHADKLQQAGVSEVEVLVDAVEPAIIEKIYAWIRPGFKTLKLSEAAEILCSEQSQAVQAFKDAGMHVRIISTLYPTTNDDHLELLAKRLSDLGADELFIYPYTPEPDADIPLPEPDSTQVATLVGALANILPTLQGRPALSPSTISESTVSTLPKPQKDKPNIAVVSSNGMDVNLHLGQAPQLLIYGPREDGLNCLLECRPAPEPASGMERWDILAGSISDCFALLTASAGERPQRILDGHGIRVVITQDNIEGTVDKLYGGGKKGRKRRTSTT